MKNIERFYSIERVLSIGIVYVKPVQTSGKKIEHWVYSLLREGSWYFVAFFQNNIKHFGEMWTRNQEFNEFRHKALICNT